MTASLRLAEQGYEVFLIEKEKELGGNLKRVLLHLKGIQSPGLSGGFDSDRSTEIEYIHLFTEAEVIGFERKNGHYRTKIRHQGEEKVLDHGALILATGGKEITPEGISLWRRPAGDHPETVGEDDSSEG